MERDTTMYAIKSVVVERKLLSPPPAANEPPVEQGASVRTWVQLPSEQDQRFHDLYCSLLLITAR
jgi:hypothetical protein